MPEAVIEIPLDEGALDALVACPDSPGRKSPILLFSDRHGLTKAVESRARRLSAHNYFVLAPNLAERSADDRREAVEACLDHLADERRVDDTRVGVLGFGGGADLALGLAAARAERIAAVAAYGPHGFGARAALEISQKINGVVRLGYAPGLVSPRAALLEAALSASGVLFDVEIAPGEPDWSGLLDLFARTFAPPAPDPRSASHGHRAAFNP